MNATALKVQTGRLKLSDEEYNLAEGVRNSNLGYALQSPAHYLEKLLNPKKPTPSQIKGSMFHSAALEPEKFKANYVVMPKFDKRTKAGKEAHEHWLIANHGKIEIPQDDYDDIQAMVEKLYEHPAACRLLSSGRAEESFFWNDPITGVLCKCKPDFKREGHIIVDIKSTENASTSEFQKSIAYYSYHRQAAFYLDGISAVTGDKYDTFILIAVEKTPPYGVAAYVLDEATIDAGRHDYKRALEIISKCQKENRWPAYSSEVEPMNLPSWAWRVDYE